MQLEDYAFYGFFFSATERNHVFLPLTWEIRLLSIKKNQFIFFFSIGKIRRTKCSKKGAARKIRIIPLYNGFLLSPKRTFNI